MAEPARRLDDDQPKGVYDEPTGTAPSPSDPRPNLRALEGGGQTTPQKTDNAGPEDSQTASESLYRAESTPGKSGSYYRGAGSKEKSRFSAQRLLTKRNAVGGGIVGAIIALIMGFTLLSGPAEMVQLSHVLQIPFSKNDSDSRIRIGRLFRFAKTGDIGETRVNRLGSKFFGSAIEDLKAKGVTITRNSLTGRPTRTTIDTDKLQEDFPDLKNVSAEERKAFLADKFGIDPSQVAQLDGTGTKFAIDQTEMDVKAASLLNKSTVALLDNNGLLSGIKTRELGKFFDLPSLFHPLSRASADKFNSIINNAQKRAAEKQQEQQRESQLTEEVNSEAAVDAGKVKGSFFNSKLGKALTLTGSACLIYDTAGSVVAVNHELVVLPAQIHAADLIALGAQAETGQDLDMSQLQTAEEDLTDPSTGKSIWQGQALNALQNGGKADASLPDMPKDYSQAFSPNTTALAIQKGVNDFFLGISGHLIGAHGACGLTGTVVQVGLTLTGIVAGAFSEVATLGTDTPLVTAAVAGKIALQEAESMAVSAIGLHFLKNFVLSKTTVKLAAGAFSGPVGGDLLAYGARAAANTAAIASGGISLANTASTFVDDGQPPASSKSIAERLFNPYDYNSAVGKLIQQSSGSPMSNVAKIGSIFTNFGSMFGHSIAAVMPGALAADKPYDWGFPQYGLPSDVLNDPNLDNPYANATQVAQLMDGSNSNTFHDRALACFGVNIKKVENTGDSSAVWDALPDHEVNPASEEYTSPTSNCNDSSEDWHRIMMFVFDTTTMKAAACYEGDDQSCADLGAESAGSPAAAGSTSSNAPISSGSLPAGSAQDIAKQIVPYIMDGEIKCNAFGFDPNCSDITNTAKGVSIKGGKGCLVDALDPVLLGMILKLAQMGHTFTFSALCSDHNGTGMAGHSAGKAADFNYIDGVFMGEGEDMQGTIPWTTQGALGQKKIQTDQRLLQDAVSFMPKTTGFGQQQCRTSFDFLSGYVLFPDGCHHQHIQVQ